MTGHAQRPLVSDVVFKALIEGVLSGRYEPGESLPPQRSIASDLGVNMAGVREAVKRLEQMGLVESRQGDGMRVRDWRAHGGLDVLAHLVVRSGLGGDMLRAVLEARRTMLVEAARLAAVRASKEQSDRLMEVATRIAAADADDGAQALDFAFFTELVEASGNIVFTLITNSIREAYLRQSELFSPLLSDRLALVPSYLTTARAVRARDPARAARAVRRLCEAQEERLIEAIG